MPSDDTAIAVIYCRVSSKKQTKKGDGLGSQETRCRDYAKYNGYEVTEVFKDDVSGSLATRPGMQAMLTYLKRHRAQEPVVIIDDISRLARGVEAHWELRRTIMLAGGRLESPSLQFGEDSDSQLIENMLASVSQHHRQKNAEQTINRMQARLRNGYWVFAVPMGYRYVKSPTQGMDLVRDEPLASVIAEALEGYAAGRFQTQAEVKRFLECHECMPRDRHGEVRNQRVKDLLTRVIYAGYVEHANWNISLRRGKHEPLISYETYRKIQDRLKGNAKVPARKDISAAFPLRGFVLCGDCNKPLTACWSSGKYRKYPYYLCATKDCSSHRKSIPRQEIEGAFDKLIHDLRPAEDIFRIGEMAFREFWNDRLTKTKGMAQAVQTEIAEIETQVGQLLDRIMQKASPTIIAAYENRIEELETHKIELRERLAAFERTRGCFDAIFRTSMAFLENPCKLWESERLEDRRAVLKLAFTARPTYVRNEGFRTPETALPFKVLASIQAGENKMARPGRFELPTS